MATYKTIRNFSYAKKLKVKPGVHNFKFEGQRVKGLITPDGRSLKIIDGSQSVVKKIKQIPAGMKLVPDGSVLRKRKDSSTSTSTSTATRTTATHTTQTQTPPVAPTPAAVVTPAAPASVTPPAPETVPAVASVPAEEEEVKSGHFGMLGPAPVLTDADRKAARMVPVADKGPITTPYIDRNSIPEHCKIKDISYYDYPNTNWGLIDDMWLVKTDSVGNEQWNQTFGGMMSTPDTDIANSLIQTSDGSFVLAGSTNPGSTSHGGYYYVVKTMSVSPPPPGVAQSVGNVIINADGSVTDTNNIQQIGSTYILTANISGTIQVQKSNVVLDGAGYAVEGNGEGRGLDLSNGRGEDPSALKSIM